MRKYLLLFCLFVVSLPLVAENASNIRVRQEGKNIVVTYDLKQKSVVTLLQELGEYITKNVSQQSILLNGKSQTPCVTPSASLDASWREWKLK